MMVLVTARRRAAGSGTLRARGRGGWGMAGRLS